MLVSLDDWMDDLQFYILFNNISVISGPLAGDNEWLCLMEPSFPGFCLCLHMDGWMTCKFTSFSTVFQSYQDDGQLIMKGCVQLNWFMIQNISASNRARTRDC